MREILFRGKDRVIGQWYEGSLIHVGNYCCILTSNCEDYGCTYLNSELGYIDGGAEPVIPETVGQYIGSTDKNDKKIFEGDIVKTQDYKGLINFNEGCYCVRLISKDWANRNNPAIDIVENEYPNDVEIIGNIHDNPELLEMEKTDD